MFDPELGATQEPALSLRILFHHDQDNMSADLKPACPRGVPVPGIDTRGAFGSHQLSPHGQANSWPTTPPSSAIDLRRPSLAFSSVSDASTSGPSSTCDFSQPATPVHSLGHSHDHSAHSWHSGTNTNSSMPEQCYLNQASQAMYNPALGHSMSGVEMANFSPARHLMNIDNFSYHSQSPMRDAWAHGTQSPLHLPDSGLKNSFFQSTQGMDHDDNSSVYANPASSVYGNPAPSMGHAPLEPSIFEEFNNVGSMYHPAQVVIPSQVNTQEDYTMEQYPGYDANDHHIEEFSRSFNSSTSGGSGWDPVRRESPEAAYYTQSEDEDYIMVKDEAGISPAPRKHHASHGSHRANRRTPRRGKKTHPVPHMLAERERHGIIVCVEGPEWEFDGRGNVIPKHPDESKPQRCTWVDEKGVKCESKFTRSEHLKRHMTKHSDEKPYPCPLEGCDKAIKRPDNAGDHFRTHLRPPVKGKRNKHCSLPELAEAMRKAPSWDDKKTAKMLTNLGKWYAEFVALEEMDAATKALAEKAKIRAERNQRVRHMHYRL